MKPLTKNQASVHAFLLAYRAARGRPPSYPEIAAHLGHKTKTTARDCCAALVERGMARYLDYEPKSDRNVVAIGTCYCSRCGQQLPESK